MKKGYTLVEILVVLVIMGFLVAMTSPKLSGILSSSEQPVDDTNQIQLEKTIVEFCLEKKRLPRKLINVVANNLGTYTLPTYGHEDTRNDVTKELMKNALLKLHALNKAESDTLKALGITKIMTLRYKGTSQEEFFVQSNVREGLPVLMIGGGATDASSTITWGDSEEGRIFDDASSPIVFDTTTSMSITDATAGYYARMDMGKYIGRIVLGINEQSELVESGILNSTGVSPSAYKNKAKVFFLNYLLILPRLNATLERIDGSYQTLHIRTYDKETKTLVKKESITLDAKKNGENIRDVVIMSPYGTTAHDDQFIYGVKIE